MIKKVHSTILIVLLLLVSKFSFAQVSNDDCSTAQLIYQTQDITSVKQGLAGALSGTASTYCYTMYGDVYFKFVAISTKAIIELTTNNYFQDPIMQLMNSCTGSTISCGDKVIRTTDLVVGNTYYIRVGKGNSSYNNAVFSLSVSVPSSPQSFCTGAIPITPDDANPVIGNFPSSAPGFGQSACGTCQAVYHKFVATSTEAVIEVSESKSADISVALFSSCTSAAIKQVNTNNIISNTIGVKERLTASNLIVGNTYYIELRYSLNAYYTNSDSYSINVRTPTVANNLCSTATTLTPSLNPTYTSGSFINAGGSSLNTCGTSLDVYYKFVANATSLKISKQSPNSTLQISHSVYTDCSGTTQVNCNNSIISGLTIGNTYYIRLSPYDGTFTTFDFSIALFNISPNDLCTGAVDIVHSSNPTPTVDNLINTTFNFAYAGSFSTNSIKDYFTFVAIDTKAIIRAKPLISSLGLNVILYSTTCGGNGVASATSLSAGRAADISVSNLTVGTRYYVRVGAESNITTGFDYPFEVSVKVPPPPRSCADAISVNHTIGEVTTEALVNSGLVSSIGGCAINNSVLYQFVATSKKVELKLKNASTTSFTRYLALVNACPSSTSLLCKSSTTDMTVDYLNLVVGNTYYVVAGADLSGTGNIVEPFYFSIRVPDELSEPVNDLCSNATTLIQVANPIPTVGTFDFANKESEPTCATNKTVFYKFTATSTNAFITLESTNNSGTYYLTVFDNCAVSTYTSCSSTNATPGYVVASRNNLIVGNEYIIQAGSSNDINNDQFKIKVQTTLANDICDNAIELTPTSQQSYVNYTTIPSSKSTSSYCTQNEDVFFKFTATATTMFVDLKDDVGQNVTLALYQSCTTGTLSCLSNSIVSSEDRWTLTNLVVGNTYYISASTYLYGKIGGFSISLITPSVTNDECADAILVEQTEDYVPIEGNFRYASTSNTICNTQVVADVFYKFVAQAKSVQIVLKSPDLIALTATILDACNASTSVACTGVSSNTTLYLSSTNLTIGQTYYLKIGTSTNSVKDRRYTLLVRKPASHDMCENAQVLIHSANPTPVIAKLIAATPSSSSYICSSPFTSDVFHSFVATSSKAVIEIKNLETVQYTIQASLVSSCFSTTSLFCSYGENLTKSSYILASNLVVGTTYYIRISSPTFVDISQPLSYSITVKVPSLSNDDCVDATLLTQASNPTPVQGSFEYAYNTPNMNCGYSFADRFYKFVAQQTTATIVFDVPPNGIMDIAMYDNCSSTTPLYCSRNTSSTLGLDMSLNVGGLIVGNTYFIRVSTESIWYTSAPFYVSVSTVSNVNEDCSTAFSILHNISGATADADLNNRTSQATPGCSILNDVYYKFVATKTSAYIEVTPGNSTIDAMFSVYSSCGSTTPLICVDNGMQNAKESATIGGLTVGQTYYIRIGSFSAITAYAPVTLYISAPDVPNDDCGSAIQLVSSVNPTPTNGSIQGAFSGTLNGCVGYKDVYYKFTATKTFVNLKVTPSSGLDVSVALLSSCASTTPTLCLNQTGMGSVETTLLQNLTLNQTYYLRIGSVSASPSSNTFTIALLESYAPNDDCASAQTISQAAQGEFVTGSFNGAYTNDQLYCGSGSDVFYKFVATRSTAIVNVVPNPVADIAYAVFSNCQSTTPIVCINNGGSGVAEKTSLSNLVVGNTYYLKVYKNPNNTTADSLFKIRIEQPPANDECANATTVLQSNTTSSTAFSFSSATTSSTNNCTMVNDVFFKFVATSTSALLNFNSTLSGIKVHVFDNCTNVSTYYCGLLSDGRQRVDNLTIGNTYVVRIGSPYIVSTDTTTYSFKVNIPVANDYCSTPQVLNVNPGTAPINVDLSFASGSGSGYDVFYSFVANATNMTVTLQSIPQGNMINNIYLSETCNSTRLYYFDNSNSYTPNLSFNAKNLVVGKTYVIGIAGTSSSYTLSVLPTASLPVHPNDLVTTAKKVSVQNPWDQIQYNEGNFNGATKNPSNPNCTTYGNDVYYKFYPTNMFKIEAINADSLNITLFYASNPQNEIEISKWYSSAQTIGSVIVRRLDTMYLRIANVSSSPIRTNFAFKITNVNNSINQLRIAAVTYDGSYLNSNSNNEYLFTPTKSNASVIYDNTGIMNTLIKPNSSGGCPEPNFNSTPYVFNTQCTYTLKDNTNQSNYHGSSVLTDLVVGKQYNIINNVWFNINYLTTYDFLFDRFNVLESGGFGSLRITSLTKGTNDDCVNAQAIDVTSGQATSSISFDNSNRNPNFVDDCINGQDMYYKFVATSSDLQITLNNQGFKLGITLAQNCDDFTNSAVCQTLPKASSTSNTTLISHDLVVGNTYWLRLSVENTVVTLLQNQQSLYALDNSTLIPPVYIPKVYTLNLNTSVSGTTGISNLVDRKAVLYPNPASNNIYIYNIDVDTDITLISVNGERLLTMKATGESAQLDIDNLPSGIYIVEIKSNSRVENKKIIVSH